MKNKDHVFAGLFMFTIYLVYVVLISGDSGHSLQYEVRHVSDPASVILSYPFYADMLFFAGGLWLLSRFIIWIIRLQEWMLKTPISIYVDIYLIAIYSVVSLCIVFFLLSYGMGLGVSSLSGFMMANLCCLTYFYWHRRSRMGQSPLEG